MQKKTSRSKTFGQLEEPMERLVKKYLRVLGTCIDKVQDRRKWRGIIGGAKNHLGFEIPRE